MRTLDELESELRAVARGERPASPPPETPSIDPVAVLTPANRRLLHLIATERPASVTALASLAGLAQPNVSRALQELAAAGYVRFQRIGRTVRPELAARFVRLDLVSGRAEPQPLTARTGERCPESGLWRAEGSPDGAIPVTVGATMPPLGNRSVIWSFAACA